jgi:hypothetical protein
MWTELGMDRKKAGRCCDKERYDRDDRSKSLASPCKTQPTARGS